MEKLNFRTYDSEHDKDTVHRIWKEIGWVEGDNYAAMDIDIEGNRTIVVDINGQPECLAESVEGNIDYLGERLPFSAIAAITVSLVARKQRLALRSTAKLLALDVAEGAAVAGLGIFDQGFYNKVGFGNGSNINLYRISPASLMVDTSSRIPIRLNKDDWERVFEVRQRHIRCHGSICLTKPFHTRAEISSENASFGLGYSNDQGKLTHLMWLHGLGTENGPYRVYWMAYENWDGFVELLGLLKSFGDQINLVILPEPPGVQLQDFLDRPFYHRNITAKSANENTCKAMAFFQWRILDLQKCLAKTHLPGEAVKFNLRLSDPVAKYLDADEPWQGVGGEYVVTLGEESVAKRGVDKSLETLECSVNAFTRLWLGNLSAASLRFSDDFKASDTLVNKLDQLIRLPIPQPDWMF